MTWLLENNSKPNIHLCHIKYLLYSLNQLAVRQFLRLFQLFYQLAAAGVKMQYAS